MKAMKSLMCLALVIVMSSGAIAADEARKAKAGARKGQRKVPSVTARLLRDIELTAEQKKQVADIDKEFAAKVAEIRKAMSGILTEEQQKTRAAAIKAAREAGQKSLEARKAIAEATKLTEEQKKKMADIQKSNRELTQQVVAALKKVLTEEQASKLNAPRARREGAKARKGDAARKAGNRKPDDRKAKKADSK